MAVGFCLRHRGQLKGFLSQEVAKLLESFEAVLLLHADWFADRYVDLLIVGSKKFAREAHGAQSPVDFAEYVAECGIAAMEINGNHGHL